MQFCKVPAQLDLDLVKTKANWTAWAMVRALSEAWYRNGHHQHHSDSFPLESCDLEKWGLKNRMQRYRAFKFLLGIGWIQIDRSNPQEPLIVMTRPGDF
jgi:hypothetical protein